MAKSPTGAVFLLQQATQAEHLHFEAQLDLLAADRTASDVAAYVQLLAPLLHDLEAHMQPLLPLLERHLLAPRYALGEACRARDLEALAPLAKRSWRFRPSTRPWAARLAQAELPCERLGVLYVLEGSRLGGLQLGRHFARRFGLSAATGLSYFLQPASERMAWPAVCRLLDGELGGEHERALACAAAVGGFACFAEALAPLMRGEAKPQVTHAAM